MNEIKCKVNLFVANTLGQMLLTDKLLAILATTDKELDVSFNVESDFGVFKNALTGEVITRNGKATLSLCGFDYLILEISN